MRKVSEMIELGMPSYEACPKRFMCCIMTDDYTINSVECLNFTKEESDLAKKTILKHIGGRYTLDGHLIDTVPEYSAYRKDGDKVIGDYYDEWPHLQRVEFYKRLIEELKAKGE
jgi:hypothetical protein